MSIKSTLCATGIAAFTAIVLMFSTVSESHAEGFAGLLTGKQRLAPITLSSGKPLAEKPYELESGKYYSIELIADGSAEISIAGPAFFRNVWINEVVINDIEVRPLGIESLEFDDEGKATISFVTIRPGTFELHIPGTTADSQRAVFIVK